METAKEAPKEAPRAIIVGGSIAGLSCAHALSFIGWKVTVIEKSTCRPSGSPTGAGLGLDQLSRDLLSRWLSDPRLIHCSTFPLSVDLNCVTESEKKLNRTLVRDDNFNFRAAHWADLHCILLNALSPELILWGHQFLSFQNSHDNTSVDVKARVVQTGEVVDIVGDLLVAADGCLSSIRQNFLPDFKLRYAGYYAWRGILDYTGKENSETITGIFKAYPELGDCLYFNLAEKTHCVFYELKRKRLNWIWYINGSELEMKGSSMTMKVNNEMIKKMHNEADKTWVPELANVMKETNDPFINLIYDSDPLPQLYWNNVVLVGDAAHPTTPHGLRSTNMSIVDAGTLGQCLEKWGLVNLNLALEEFQSIRLPVVSKQVLHARKLGRIKQGLIYEEGKVFNPINASSEECLQLQQRNMPFFEGVPYAN